MAAGERRCAVWAAGLGPGAPAHLHSEAQHTHWLSLSGLLRGLPAPLVGLLKHAQSGDWSGTPDPRARLKQRLLLHRQPNTRMMSNAEVGCFLKPCSHLQAWPCTGLCLHCCASVPHPARRSHWQLSCSPCCSGTQPCGHLLQTCSGILSWGLGSRSKGFLRSMQPCKVWTRNRCPRAA